MKFARSPLGALFGAIASRNGRVVLPMLAASPDLARMVVETGATQAAARDFFFEEIAHCAYPGDTALHMAAAAHLLPVAHHLLAKGANVRAKNRRGAEPLHYACDGVPGSAAWNPDAQAAVVRLLIDAGADPNAKDKSGGAPLHRAVRTRCASAVRALLEGGADSCFAEQARVDAVVSGRARHRTWRHRVEGGARAASGDRRTAPRSWCVVKGRWGCRWKLRKRIPAAAARLRGAARLAAS